MEKGRADENGAAGKSTLNPAEGERNSRAAITSASSQSAPSITQTNNRSGSSRDEPTAPLGSSLSKTVTLTPRSETAPPPFVAFPVEGKPGWYDIGGELVGPDYRFSFGQRLKGDAHERAKAYVVAESVRLRGAVVCELGDHHLTETTAEVHHRVRRDYHVAKALGVACHSHNAVHGDPEQVTTRASETVRERDPRLGILTPTQKANAELKGVQAYIEKRINDITEAKNLSSATLTPDTTAPHRTAPPDRERKHYETLKRLEDGNRDEWLYDWVYENGASCPLCGKPLDLSYFHIHHKDKTYRPINAWENIEPMHPLCNKSYNEFESSALTAPHAPRERKFPTLAEFPAPYSAQEGRDHQSMRKNWNDWTRGRRVFTFPLLEALKRGNRMWVKAGDVCLLAASACQDAEDDVQHSSKTYRVFLEEDIFEGLYDSKVVSRVLWVRISHNFREVLAEVGALKVQVTEVTDGSPVPPLAKEGPPTVLGAATSATKPGEASP